MSEDACSRKKDVRALVIYSTIPHYRRGVFQALEGLPFFQFTFAASPENFGNIESASFDQFEQTIEIRNTWAGPLLWQRRVVSLILSRRYDVVIFSGDAHYMSTWAALIVARLTRTPTALWTIGWHRRPKGARDVLRRWFYRRADHLLLYGEHAKQIAKSEGFQESQLSVIRNSIENSSVRHSDDFQDLRIPHQYCIGAVIRLSENKGLDKLISTAASLRSEGLDVAVLLVGRGPMESSLRALAERFSVPLYIPGAAYSRERLADVYRHLDVTVVPRNVGLTAIQSLQHGTPVVSHNDPEDQMPEWESIRQGVTGSTVSPSSEGLVSAVRFWLLRDLSQRERDQQNCLDEVAAHWNPEVQARLIHQALETVLQRHSANDE
ncbi:hypothetical protein GCM10009821_27120 [Aeromicrobium halocynthiae]|uniref:Glycosyltransferase subfamily 4-like N-terminal domain-containing protein n=1 Tax=Aeromicrobium halocynthiae TaxID=560557 RepID=A0ABN2W7U9_9ACTN